MTRNASRMVMKKYGYLHVFLLAFGAALLVFLPAMIWDRGYLIFLGDFNSQQIPFYHVAHRAIRSGSFGWDWQTDLGVNFIGSYSFYLLGSPFFWLTVPFPEHMISYLMGPLLILKFACAAVTSYAWLRRHVQKPQSAVLGSLLYAFSGFSIYNIFFNHFHEAIVFFPLLLIGLDELIDHDTKGVFALAVCVNAVVSYFFFVGEVVFTVIYFFVRFFTRGYTITWKKFAFVALEAVLGFLLSQFLFLPSLFVMLSNSRVSNYPDGLDIWVYANNQRLYVILASFLFPNELPSKQVLFPDASVRWTSLNAYIPLFSVSGALAYVRTHKKHWLSVLLKVLLVMTLVPGLNSTFVAFNRSFYARWYYMFTLMLSLATVKMVDEERVRTLEKSAMHVLVITGIVVLIIGLTPDLVHEKWRIGLFAADCIWQFAVIVGVALVSLGVLLLLLDEMRHNPERSVRFMIVTVLVISVLYGNFYMVWGKSRSYDTHTYFIPDVLEGKFETEETRFFRIDQDDSCINTGMFWNVPSIRAFHSLVPASVFDFYDFIDEERSVKSAPSYDNYAIRALLSVKYFVDSQEEGDDFQSSMESEGEIYYENKMPGFVQIGAQNDYDIYENQNYLPMGFTYDRYCTKSEAEDVSEFNRALLMLDTLILEDDAPMQVRALLEHNLSLQDLDYSEEGYAASCAELRQHTADTFKTTRTGFTASIYSEKENLLFFSVPYEEGWSAKVNGLPMQILKANVGFMAVQVPAGSSTVTFTYHTPWLKAGVLISAAAAIMFVVYLVLAWILDRKKVLV